MIISARVLMIMKLVITLVTKESVLNYSDCLPEIQNQGREMVMGTKKTVMDLSASLWESCHSSRIASHSLI